MTAGTNAARTVHYLSDEYLAELSRLTTAAPAPPARADVRLQFHATDTPEGEIDHYWVVRRGTLTRAARGRLETPDLTITATYADLVAFQTGELHVATALVTGRFAVEGDKAKLLELMLVLQTGHYARAAAALWERTQW
ncbi:hypothetical protein GCM10027598_79130 [Amycolatopsis oliviviridis]|uniref:Alkyl sulfatase C-terminal domain-containing protein n=1 Tax=Amycolatopsis oliviviridis TaxID=1471590 RepID=A0ABQ3L682_9PSEU|nr:alkyl sulfatase C-terminal domain-containing protein [Amycolatopsis oliviviridis]GHH05299.1 hypothetical protein GCM10017790_09060 [Amycolatopsis oliviviridis]